jgi:hypothetical protein
MLQHAVIITFKDDLDRAVIDDFLAATEEIFADTPFRTVAHGRGLGVLPASADWGYTGLLESDDIATWHEHHAHLRLRDLTAPLTKHVCHIQIHVD